jgi:hypothetical protein
LVYINHGVFSTYSLLITVGDNFQHFSLEMLIEHTRRKSTHMGGNKLWMMAWQGNLNGLQGNTQASKSTRDRLSFLFFLKTKGAAACMYCMIMLQLNEHYSVVINMISGPK